MQPPAWVLLVRPCRSRALIRIECRRGVGPTAPERLLFRGIVDPNRRLGPVVNYLRIFSVDVSSGPSRPQFHLLLPAVNSLCFFGGVVHRSRILTAGRQSSGVRVHVVAPLCHRGLSGYRSLQIAFLLGERSRRGTAAQLLLNSLPL